MTGNKGKGPSSFFVFVPSLLLLTQCLFPYPTPFWGATGPFSIHLSTLYKIVFVPSSPVASLSFLGVVC